MRGPNEHLDQPDWYKVAVAAKWLGMSFRELNETPEPARTIMVGWGMTGNNAEAKAAKNNSQPWGAAGANPAPPAL